MQTRLTIQYGPERETKATMILETDDTALVDDIGSALLRVAQTRYSDGRYGCSVLHEEWRDGRWACPVQ